MKVNWKHWYSYIKKVLGFKKDDFWDDNPFVVL